MNIIPYTDKHHKFREKTRAFVEKEIIPNVDQWEKDKIVPKSAWQKMGQEGLLCTTIPKKYGGPGYDLLYAVIVAEELALSNHYGLHAVLHSDVAAPYIYSYGSEYLRNKYLPGCCSGDIVSAIAMTEPNAGSDLASIETMAVDDGDEIVLNGSKIFISNGINCGVAVVAAKNPSDKSPYESTSLYVVESDLPGFIRGKKLEKMGFNSQDTVELFFSNCRIPKTNMLGQKGMGFKMLMEKLQFERLLCSVQTVATAEFSLAQLLKHQKTTSVSGQPIQRTQSSQFALVEMATEIKLGKTMLETLIVDHMAGKNILKETSMAKYWNSELARRVAEGCIELHGMQGALESFPVVRAYRDVRILSIAGGTTEIMKGIIAKEMGI